MKDGPGSSSANYRLLQFLGAMEQGEQTVLVRALVPKSIWQARYNATGPEVSRLKQFGVGLAYHAAIAVRGTLFMIIDSYRGVETIVVLRSLQPKTHRGPFRLIYRYLLARASRTIWDFDDDIAASREIGYSEMRLLMSEADVIVVTHKGLQDLLPPEAQDRVFVLPTTDGDFANLDVLAVNAIRKTTLTTEVRLVWVGSSSGIDDLKTIAPALDRAALQIRERSGRQTRLEVVCNLSLDYKFQNLELTNTVWNRDAARNALMCAHVGLMPLIDTQFSRGKGGFKLIQYISAALPVVATGVGFNNEIVNPNYGRLVPPGSPDEWVDRVQDLIEDAPRWEHASTAARARWETSFSFEHSWEFWANAVRLPDCIRDDA